MVPKVRESKRRNRRRPNSATAREHSTGCTIRYGAKQAKPAISSEQSSVSDAQPST
jgi:hypothetical protein